MSNEEIWRFQKMEKLLENKISRRFKVRRLDKDDFGYLIEHLYGQTGTAYEDYEYYLPKKRFQEETLVKYYDLIKPTRCLIEENQRYLKIEQEDGTVYAAYFTINSIVGELDFPSSEIFYYQQQQFTFPIDTSMNVEIVTNRKALSTVRNKKKELKDLDNHAWQNDSETSTNVVDALDSVNELESTLDQSKESMYKLSYVVRVTARFEREAGSPLWRYAGAAWGISPCQQAVSERLYPVCHQRLPRWSWLRGNPDAGGTGGYLYRVQP